MRAELENLPWLQSVGWTILHSIWQVLVIYIVHRAVQRLLRRAASTVRYVSAVLMLVICAAAPIITFVAILDGKFFSEPASAMTTILAGGLYRLPSVPAAAWWAGWTANAQWVMPFVSASWLIGVGYQVYRTVTALHGISTLKRVCCPIEAKQSWITLASSIVPGSCIRFVEAPHLNLAATVGWLRPVIILPMGFMSALSPSEVDAVIAHELAHIHRRDFAVNLLQNMVEAMLFFHPCARLISWQIRCLREECCDDIAVRAIGGSHKSFATALASVSSFVPMPAMGLAGGSIVDRVKRLRQNQVQPPRRTTSRFMAILLIALIAIATVCSQSARAFESERQLKMITDQPFGVSVFETLHVPFDPNPELAPEIVKSLAQLKEGRFDRDRCLECARIIVRGGAPDTLYRQTTIPRRVWQKVAKKLVAQAQSEVPGNERTLLMRGAVLLSAQANNSPGIDYFENLVADEKLIQLTGLPRDVVVKLQLIITVCTTREREGFVEYLDWQKTGTVTPVPLKLQKLAGICPTIADLLEHKASFVFVDLSKQPKP